MRIQPWMTAVAGALMLLASQSRSSGQQPGLADPYGYGAAGSSPGAYAQPPASAGYSADPNAFYPAGVPESFQPWPQMSPFSPGNVGQDSTYNSNGLWFRELLYKKRTWVGSIEATGTVYRDAGSATIGSPFAPVTGRGGSSYTPDGEPVPWYSGTYPEVPNYTPSVNGVFSVSQDIFPYPALSTTSGTYVVMNTGLFPIYSANQLGNNGTAGGIKGRLGFFNEDDTGVVISGWYGGQATSTFNRGNEFVNGIAVNQTITQALGGQNLTPTNGNVPLYNGESGLSFFGAGSTAKYDVLYSLRYRTEAAGANINIYQQPLLKSEGFKIRPLWGIRYQYIGETFNFRGIDSGFNYNITGNTTSSSTSSTTGTTGSTGRPVNTTLTRLYDQYTATLNNSVISHIAGPEIGFRIDLGEDDGNFRVWGETNLGLAVNSEQVHLYGDNIGDPLVDVRFNGNTTPRMLDPNNQSAFDTTNNSAHVSPMFQQSVYADMKLLDVVPVIKRMNMFEHASFRVGYTFMWVGSVARPTDSINWQGYPLYPQIKNNRSGWWANQFSLGFDWNY